ncbi:HAMP domain-containing sensor histidine kinase [Mucilaginibacter paludis]|uniref:histidine kinase n=1 Tax=Mucilaginibacter paludis DSM 18603 TaxID=714943 RepID=H1Y807_9SPHI|nr:HAMP domain-containing sensor histidine kinase [Mucilaginibacter paludis]EHQ30493.1 integral membrane sensor signal transduction histidine kinase [Mucilaginibacter paludis DSM 18603]
MKIQTKITLLFLAFSVAILLLLNAFILYFEYQFNYKDFYKRLEARVNLTAQIRLLDSEKSKTYQEIRNKYLEKLDAEKEQILKADTSGKFVNAGLPADFFDNLIAVGSDIYKDDNQFFAGRVFTRGAEKYMVVVSASNPYGLQEIQELKRILLIGFFGSLIVIFFAGKLFSYYTFIPVRQLNDKMQSITSNNLHLRLEPAGTDELAELANTFNDMLNRLETAFETQNNFVSNASHELRTPLTIINSELEIALRRGDNSPSQLALLNTIHAESDKLTQILNSLLLLAQSGYDGKKQSWQKIRIDELIWQAVESVKKIHPESNIQVDFSALPDNEEALNTLGNGNLLNLAITNIINNSCKYSQNKLVVIKLSVQSKKIIIAVTDKGIGIPATELQHIFEPFFRASNTHDYNGHGVGLPLALNIIRLHKGSIGIRSEVNVGTEIQLFLPSMV